MVQRLTGKDAISALKLGKEVGVSQTTLSLWLAQARSLRNVKSQKHPPRTWSVDDKIRILSDASKLTGEQLATFLDGHGLLLAELEQWRLSLDEEGRSSNTVTKRIRALERELARKERALVEAAALLILKKKLHDAFGEEDDDTDKGSEK
jgi:transposase